MAPPIPSFINRFNLIKQIPIFNQLNWVQRQKIARKAIISEYKKGDRIAKEGNPADFFYCLVSGRVQSYSMGPEGEKENIDFLHRGMHFGIISILTGENHSHNFEAINDSIVLKIAKADFHALLKSMPQLGIELSQSLSKRIRGKVQGAKSIFESMVISVYSPSKGTGSSTYALNIAMSLVQETHKKVIFVNIHSRQGQLTKGEGTGPQEASLQWKTPAVDLNDIVGDYEKAAVHIIKNDLNVDLLNVVFDPQDTALKKEIGLFISALVGDYHYVVVDLPNEMDDIVLETLTHADLVHLITLDRKKDLELIRNVIDRLQAVLKERFREDKIRVLVRAVHDKIYLSFEEIDSFIDYHVYMALPVIHSSELTEKIDSPYFSFSRCHHRSGYIKAVTHIARQIGGVSVGLALSGGAALGIAHIGVIKVLEQEDIPVDVIVGSSMGAIIASLWAIGKTRDELVAIAREFARKRDLLKLLDPVFPISGLIGGHAIKRWLKRHFGNRTFYNTKIPLKVVAYDLIKREELVIDSGSIVEALQQSIAIPGVLEPVKKKNQWIIDGGVLNPLPTNVLVRRGIKKIIAVNVLQSPEDVSAGFEIMQQRLTGQKKIRFLDSPLQFLNFRLGGWFSKIFSPNISDIIVRTLQATEHVIAEQNAQQADVVIHPDLVGINWFELYRVDELIERGETAAREKLAVIKKLVEAK